MIGGITSLTAAWLTQSRQATIQWLVQDKSRRQKLYKEFIEEASKVYADALAHNEAEVSAFVKVYALMSREARTVERGHRRKSRKSN
jgi:aminoglycoside/choline kinase family phosphotransferase